MKKERPGRSFEHLVARLHQSEGRKISHQSKLEGRAGRKRTVDVKVHDDAVGDPRPFIVECKHHQRKIGRDRVDILANTIRDLDARGGAIFSASGFQAGAISQAQYEGIQLVKVRELTDAEWGGPGRIIHFFHEVMTFSFGNVQLHEMSTRELGQQPERNTAITLMSAALHRCRVNAPGQSEITFGKFLVGMAQRVAMRHHRPALRQINPGAFHSTKARIEVSYKPPRPVRIYLKGGVLSAAHLTFDLGIQIDQFELNIDRKAEFDIALAGEDCITGDVTIYTKKAADEYTSTAPFMPTTTEASDIPFRNGALLWFRLPQPVPFSEFAELPANRFVTSQENLPFQLSPVDEEYLKFQTMMNRPQFWGRRLAAPPRRNHLRNRRDEVRDGGDQNA